MFCDAINERNSPTVKVLWLRTSQFWLSKSPQTQLMKSEQLT